jgi:RNA recognition motif-containing protein
LLKNIQPNFPPSIENINRSRERKNRVAGNPDIVNRSVYVTGLTWDTDEAELSQYFAQAGSVVNATILRQRRSGNSKSSMGCGVVEFATPEMAANAVVVMNETELKGRIIRCREDRNPEDTEDHNDELEPSRGSMRFGAAARDRRSKNDGGDRSVAPTKVFVSSLTWDTTEDDLVQYFGTCGAVVSAEVLSTRKGRSMGSGVVEFSDPTSVPLAIERLNNVDFKGRVIAVREYFQ